MLVAFVKQCFDDRNNYGLHVYYICLDPAWYLKRKDQKQVLKNAQSNINHSNFL